MNSRRLMSVTRKWCLARLRIYCSLEPPATRNATCRPHWRIVRCPSRVKSDGLAMSTLLPLYPCKPTFIVSVGMSQMCHNRTHAPQQLPTFYPLFRSVTGSALRPLWAGLETHCNGEPSSASPGYRRRSVLNASWASRRAKCAPRQK